MYSQYYNIITKNAITYVALTNVYRHLFLNNKSVYEVKVYYRDILVLVLPPQSNMTLYDVFKICPQERIIDANIQLKFETLPEAEIELINFGV